ncbi:MAG: nucleotidyltransferase domain-containing protein [Candidatus Kerfeldbacteria bacterium]|nr:nucleotidyltransferase domain-containing protein [Candidatus Kerfeldbacteria bacterium]
MKITEKQRIQLAEVAKEFDLKLLYLFGSHARGDANEHSDVDLAYLRHDGSDMPRGTFFSLQGFDDKIENILGLSESVFDCVNLVTAPPLLGYLIATEGIKLFGTETDDEKQYIRLLMKYFDAEPLFKATHEYVKTKLLQFEHAAY